ncbi:MAG: hypothetical protein PHH98_00940 [Candidatus Gracilibacteria bacterium]|nr:hypothetical protein [Candidatus Gracilibacteria bacterium]
MTEVPNIDKHKNNPEKSQSLSETFNWFANNKYFIQDVGDILLAEKSGPEELAKLKKEYENKLETTNYKKHFNSLVFLINFINEEKGNVYVIETIKDFVDSSMVFKKQREELKKEVENNPKKDKSTTKKSESSISSISTNAKTEVKKDSDKKTIVENKSPEAQKESVDTKPELEKIIGELSNILNQNEKNLGLKNFGEKDKILGVFRKKVYDVLGNPEITNFPKVKNNFLLQIKDGFDKIKNITKADINAVRNQMKKVDSTFSGSDSEVLTTMINSNFFQDIINHGEAIKLGYLETTKIEGSKTKIKETYPTSILNSFYSKLGDLDKKSGLNIKEDVIKEIQEKGRISLQTFDIDSIVLFKLKEKVLSKKMDKNEANKIKNEYSNTYSDFLMQNNEVNKFKSLNEGNKTFSFDSEKFDEINLLTFEERISGLSQNELKLLQYMLEEVIPYVGDAKTIERRISDIKIGFGMSGKKMGGIDKGLAVGEIMLSILAVISGYALLKSGIKTGSILNKIQKLKGIVGKTISLKSSAKAEKKLVDSSNLESHFSNSPLKKRFEKEGKNKTKAQVESKLKLWQENIANFPKEIHAKLAEDPEYLENLVTFQKQGNDKLVRDIIAILKRDDAEPRLIFNYVKKNNNSLDGFKLSSDILANKADDLDDVESATEDYFELDDLINKYLLSGDKTTKGILNMNPIINRNLEIVEKAGLDLTTLTKSEKEILAYHIKTNDGGEKISTFIKSRKNNPKNEKVIIESKSATKKIESVSNVNKDGALKLSDVTIDKLGEFDSVPRIIEISDGKFVSVVSTSVTTDGKKVFTVRYGITNSNVKLPPFEGISTFVVDEKKISFSTPKTRLESSDYADMQKALFDKIGGKRELVEESPLEKLALKSTINKTGETSSISNLEIFKAGKNSKGQDVLIINVNDANGKGLSQFEVNIYKEGKDLVFYLGSMAKSSKSFNMNDLFELIPKIGDLAGDTNDVSGYKIKYFRIDSTGEAGKEKVINVKPNSEVKI